MTNYTDHKDTKTNPFDLLEPQVITQFRTSDGNEFDTYEDAVIHEACINIGNEVSKLTAYGSVSQEQLYRSLTSPEHPLTQAIISAHLAMASLADIAEQQQQANLPDVSSDPQFKTLEGLFSPRKE